jgi:hypothetical protein
MPRRNQECRSCALQISTGSFLSRRMSLLNFTHPILLMAITCGGSVRMAVAETDAASVEVIASVSEQRMVIVRDGAWVKKCRISTSRFGLGDNFGSYKTPIGRMRICEKLGDGLPAGAVIKHRQATGEILEVNAPGRDPIVSRILWLEGLEPQNEHARARSIYIHGTPEETRLGKPVSWGCIRMRSEDVVELYDLVPLGALVTILDEDLPRLPKWKPEPPLILAKHVESTPRTEKTVPTAQRPPPAQRIRELPLPVAELLRANPARPIPADPGAADSLRGSILFAGISQVPKPPLKAPASKGKVENVRNEPPIADSFTGFRLSAPPLMSTEFSLASTAMVSDLRLLDLRRSSVEPENSWPSVLEEQEATGRVAWLTPETEQRLIRVLRTVPMTKQTPF